MCPIKVSVIVPIYNAQKYLRECLDSIVNQTFKEIEIVLVDDGSTDGCADICKSYLNDSRVKYFYKINEGPAAARQYGIEHAQGEYIGFVDADDWIEPQTMEYAYRAAIKSDADIVQFNEMIDGKRTSADKANGIYYKEDIENEILPDYLGRVTSNGYERSVLFWWHIYTKIFRREFIKENALKFNRQLYCGEDFVFSFGSFCAANILVGMFDSHFYHYRVNGNNSSITRCYKENHINSRKLIREIIIDYINDKTCGNLIQRMNIFVFFQACDLLINEWVYSPFREQQMIKNLDMIAEDSEIKRALNNISRDKLSERYKPDYDILCCDSGEQMYRLLKRHPYIGSRMRFRLKRRFGNSKLFANCNSKLQQFLSL